MSFASLGLNPQLLGALARAGYQSPTPIQSRAIPAVLAGHDLLAAAQTGTGKTAAFTLPILEQLTANPRAGKNPRVLILTPTRELAAQVLASTQSYGQGMKQRSLAVFGGVNANPQIRTLNRGCDILVATPGRLLDLANQGHANLRQIEIFVMDEADRMLDMGFIHDIKRIIKLLPPQRQNLMFSATFSPEIRDLAKRIVANPVEIDISPRNSAVESVRQRLIRVAKDQKRELLSHLIGAYHWDQALVFTRTKHGANRLCKQLDQDGIEATAIHGNKSQAARTKALAAFKSRKLRVLVATDIAARGLDIDQLPHVINYELPMVAEDYVHRIGRTGRAGSEGEALSLVCNEELKQLRAIQKMLGRDIPAWNVSEQFSLRAESAGPAQPAKQPPRPQPRGKPQAKRGQPPTPGGEAHSPRRGSRRGGRSRQRRA